MPNLSALAPLTTAAQSLANLILVSPQSTVGYQPNNPPNDNGTPSTAQNPPRLLFHYEGEQTVTLESDITDHYVEGNYAVQDQIAIKPEVITTHGFIGELNDVVPDALKPVKFIADKLTTVGSYEPALSATALLAYSEAFFLYQTASTVVNSAVSAWESVGNFITGGNGQNVIGGEGISDFNFSSGDVAPSQNKQQTAFQQFYGYWRARTLFTVQTPWAVFENMAIKSLRAIQDAETNMITDFEISFKMIRKASTTLESFTGGFSNPGIGGLGRGGASAAPETNQGTSSGGDFSSLSGSIDTQMAIG